jgi:hypothetical protein
LDARSPTAAAAGGSVAVFHGLVLGSACVSLWGLDRGLSAGR